MLLTSKTGRPSQCRKLAYLIGPDDPRRGVRCRGHVAGRARRALRVAVITLSGKQRSLTIKG